MSTNSEDLRWIWNLLVSEHEEDPRSEHMLRLDKIIGEIEEQELNKPQEPVEAIPLREPSRAEIDVQTYLPCPCGRWNTRNENCVCLQKEQEPRRPFREIKCPQCGLFYIIDYVHSGDEIKCSECGAVILRGE